MPENREPSVCERQHEMIERFRAERDMLSAIYDKALLDPNARLPTYLHAALEALRK